MAFQQDWIMRQIEMISQFLARLLYGTDSVNYEEYLDEEHLASDALFRALNSLTQQGKISEAENLLFEQMNPASQDDLQVALDFYERLNDCSDEELEAGDFSREEVEEGLRDVIHSFGVELPQNF